LISMVAMIGSHGSTSTSLFATLRDLGPLDNTTFQPTSCVESKKKTCSTCEGKVKGVPQLEATTWGSQG
jgi:hypothetical protein